MEIPSSMPRLKGFRHPREIIAYAVLAYHRFALSTADVEDLLAERGIVVSREPIRLWVNRFGAHFAACIRRDRPRPNDKLHLDEVVISINGVKHWLWRAVDANGDALDILVQTRRNAKAAKRFLARLIARFGTPRVVITDKLRSYTKPIAYHAPITGHIRASATGLKAAIGQPDGGKRSWGASSLSSRRSVSSPPTIRLTPSSVRASQPYPIATQDPMPANFGPTMLSI